MTNSIQCPIQWISTFSLLAVAGAIGSIAPAAQAQPAAISLAEVAADLGYPEQSIDLALDWVLDRAREGVVQRSLTPALQPEVRLEPGFQMRNFSGVSGGSIPMNRLVSTSSTQTGPCVGFAERPPDHLMILSQFFDGLQVRVESTRDTTLAVVGPGGVWCNDDADDSINPRISGQWLPGSYQIWVGSFARDRYFPYTLIIEEN